METQQTLLSRTRICRLKAQGYQNYSDSQITALAFGNRFAYIICTAFLGLGVALANVQILSVMALIALGGVILPYHPFDYLYNHGLRNVLHKPKLPPRSKQLKFACIMATLWLIATIILFSSHFTIAGFIVGTMLFLVALTVSTLDFCIPSMIYNLLFRVETEA